MKKRLKFILLIIVIICNSCNKNDLNPGLIENIGLPVNYDNNGNVHLNVAVVSFSASETKADNITKMNSMIEQIKTTNPETRLITFGETALSLYYTPKNTTEYNKSVAETIPGNATDLFGEIAKNKNIYIAFGMYELDGDKVYNSLILIDTTGNIIAKHRKVNLTDYDISVGITAGEKSTIPIAYIDGIKTGLAICADGQDYWLTQQFTKAKIKLLIHSIADENNEILLGNGIQYNAWVVSSNRTGSEIDQTGYTVIFSGYHFVSDPAGKIIHFSEGNDRYNVAKINVYL